MQVLKKAKGFEVLKISRRMAKAKDTSAAKKGGCCLHMKSSFACCMVARCRPMTSQQHGREMPSLDACKHVHAWHMA